MYNNIVQWQAALGAVIVQFRRYLDGLVFSTVSVKLG